MAGVLGESLFWLALLFVLSLDKKLIVVVLVVEGYHDVL